MLLVMASALFGCVDAVSVHSLESLAYQDQSSVPDLSGIWLYTDTAEDDGYLAVQFFADKYDVGGCRDIRVTVLSDDLDFDGVVLGDRVCAIPVAGELLLETRMTDPVKLYRHFQVRVTNDVVAVCGGLDVWSLLLASEGDGPGKFSLGGLQYTKSEGPGQYSIFYVVTSEPDELFNFLKGVLPRLAQLCDTNTEQKDSPSWVTFKRVTPPRRREEDVAKN